MDKMHSPMQVGVASITRFHMFDLARQMLRLRQPVHLFTGLPEWKVDADLRGVSHCHWARTVLWRAISRLPMCARASVVENAAFADFGKWLSRIIEPIDLDILEAMDGIGLEAGRLMRDRGKVWVCGRASCHVLTQKQILQEEFALWGQKLPESFFHPWLVDRCLEEYQRADAISCPSQFVKRSFVERGFAAETVHVNPFGVDLSAFAPQPKHDDKFRVLFVGGQCIRKGIGYVFEALRPLIQAGTVELWLIGNPMDDAREILRRNAGLYTHQGVQPRSRLSRFYSQGSVLVLPSVEEGLAYVQAQAMACGIPVIATPNTGAEDLFTNNVEGFIVPIRDPGAIRDKIQLLLDNRDTHRKMSEAALQRVRGIGGWDSYGDRSLDLYRRLCPVRGFAHHH